MKTKLIAGLTALSVLAFPMSALAAQTTPQTPVCSVEGCQIEGDHPHNGEAHGNCNNSHSQKNGQSSHSSSHGSHH